MEDQNYQTYTEAKTVDPMPLYTEQPKKKSNAWWIILLVVLLVLCCCVVIGGVVVFFLVASGQYRIDWSLLTPILSFI
jgi:uncharacterized membrane-anchored protein